MDPERWRRLEAAFEAALEAPSAERAAIIASACGDDPELAAEVSSLVAAAGGADGQIRAAIGRVAHGLATGSAAGEMPRRIGPYRLERELGAGGMGTVFLAVRDDDQYRAEVAVKVLRQGFESTSAIARFREERQILASLEHPGIVRLLDGGNTDSGLPYLVMEYVDGLPLTRWVSKRGPTLRAQIELFRKVCAIVQFAHQKLVVHRDIKPQNILVTADGTPKLLDFGIAKLLDDGTTSARTRTGMQVFTPEYASPEQLRGELVTPASDVYSLGAVLYELLCGVGAHRTTGSALELMRAIVERDPPRPSSLAPAAGRRGIAGDLDNITMKALHKDPAHRYASVAELSEDLARHLDGRPVLARTATWPYRAGKYLRRNRLMITVTSLVVLALASATIVSTREAARADAQAEHAQRRFADVRRLANTLLLDVDAAIGGIEGTSAARELIVSRALPYLEMLAEESEGDAALQRELGIAYLKIGEIQWSELVPSLGRLNDARASIEKARRILQGLVDLGARDRETLWSLAGAIVATAHIEKADGQESIAIAHLDQAIAMLEPIERRTASEHEQLLRAYTLRFAMADAVGSSRDFARVAAKLEAEARAFDRAYGSLVSRFWVGVGHEGLASAKGVLADPEGALTDFEAAHAVFVQLSADEPNNAMYLREVAFAEANLGLHRSGHGDGVMWSPSTGDSAGAERAFRSSLSRYERLAARDMSDSRATLSLVTAYEDLAIELVARAPAEAVETFERARRMLEAMTDEVVEAASNSNFITLQGTCALPEALARLGRAEEAAAALEVCMRQTQLPSALGDTTFARRLQRSEMLFRAARAHVVLGQDGTAEAHFEEAARELGQLVVEAPDHVHGYVGLVETLSALAELRPRDTCALREEALAVWRSWPATPTAYSRRRAAEFERAADACDQNLR